ncbi:LacI family DNA-binding transcriptional regulator [Mitsuokella multacida]|jgi:LacI family sucrose operon transcriptional repressor|uniref:LacI family DNA-binding transcriptional regulator n=1 Tax=Mitsuokella multacida TaxID=52226 RepID=UPI00242D501A|nr:LacI family DNA-binding transcriptional regulator [Mitsuokella multacida]
MARIKDVAKLAGVSTSTVSLVLNNKGYVSAATRAKVEAAVQELHYVPSEVGRNLSLNRTNLIGVIIPDVAHPFFAALLHEIEIALYDYGYKTMICSTGEKKNAELAFLDMLRRHTMDGLIIGAHALHIENYQHIELPVIAFDRYLCDEIPIIRADHYQGGQLAANALLKRHPHHVVQITGAPTVHTTAHEHEDIFAQVIKQASVPLDTIVMPANALQPKDFSTAAREVFERYPDVDAISGTDLGAICALREASRRGRRCPDDLSIVAYDGTYLTRLGPQTMTAVVQPIPTLGRRAAEAIVRRIRHEELPSLQPLPMGFQQGETC